MPIRSAETKNIGPAARQADNRTRVRRGCPTVSAFSPSIAASSPADLHIAAPAQADTRGRCLLIHSLAHLSAVAELLRHSPFRAAPYKTRAHLDGSVDCRTSTARNLGHYPMVERFLSWNLRRDT